MSSRAKRRIFAVPGDGLPSVGTMRILRLTAQDDKVPDGSGRPLQAQTRIVRLTPQAPPTRTLLLARERQSECSELMVADGCLYYIFSTIAFAKPLVDINVAPSMSRSKSYVTRFCVIVFSRLAMTRSAASVHPM